MTRALLLALAAVIVASAPATAKVLAEGKPSAGGYYWQKVQNSSGNIQYLCRKMSDSKILKDAACNGAKAVKPK
jgi:nucleoside-specific outer membrane channel protein Tsx